MNKKATHIISYDKINQSAMPVIILGGAGDGLVVLEILHRMMQAGSALSPAGFLNDSLSPGDHISGLPVLGNLESWMTLPEHCLFIPALHKVKAMPARAARIQSLGIPENRWTNAIDPNAVLAQGTKFGVGCNIGAYAVIQPGAKLGSFLSIRAGANIGHDCTVEDFSYIGPNCVMCGGALMKKAAYMAPGAVLANNVRLGAFAVLGAASAGLKDIPDGAVALGNPARIIEHQFILSLNRVTS